MSKLKHILTTLSLFAFVLIWSGALAGTNPTTMAYSTDQHLLNGIDESQVLALIDDEKLNVQSLVELQGVSTDEAHPDQATALKQLQRLDQARINADEMIDVYLISHRTVPIPEPVPGAIRKLSVDLTIYHLYERRMRDNIPDGIEKIFKANIATLKELQRGTIRASDDPKPEAAQFATNKRASDRVFNRDLLDRFS